MTGIQIVTLSPEEWQLYKQIRLEALLTEPQAFGSTYADMLQRPDSFWQGRLAEAQAGEKSWLLFAMEDNRIIGMIGAYRGEEEDVVGIISVYVTREKRGQGVSNALMAAILEEVGRKRIFRKARLGVNAAQTAAVALYRRFGFEIVEENTEIQGDGKDHPGYRMEKKLGVFLILCGLSFAGKSTLGRAIAEKFGYEEVDVDETKFQLFRQSIRDEDLHPEDWVRIYAETDRRIETILKSGRSVVDASRNFSKVERANAKRIAVISGVPILTIWVNTSEETARQRLLENRRNPTRRDVTDTDFADVVNAWEPPGADENPLVFDGSGTVDDWIHENEPKLRIA